MPSADCQLALLLRKERAAYSMRKVTGINLEIVKKLNVLNIIFQVIK
jgi:hypothetical protein